MSACIRYDYSETTLFFVVVFLIEVCITSKYKFLFLTIHLDN